MRDWLRRHPSTIGFAIFGIVIALVIWRQNANFSDHQRIDRARARSECLLELDAWRYDTQLAVNLATPLVPPKGALPDLVAWVNERNRQFNIIRERNLKLLGPEPIC